MRILLVLLILNTLLRAQALNAADHFLYFFQGHERVGDVLHKYDIGPLWGPSGQVAKTVKMNKDLMDENGQLYETGVWVKLPVSSNKNWQAPAEIANKIKVLKKDSTNVAMMDTEAFQQSQAERQLIRNNGEKAVFVNTEGFQNLGKMTWGHDPFRMPAGIRKLSEEAAKKRSELSLEFIEYDPEYPAAILDGKTVYEGSVTNAGAIIKIGRDFLLIKNGSEVRQIVLEEEKGAQ